MKMIIFQSDHYKIYNYVYLTRDFIVVCNLEFVIGLPFTASQYCFGKVFPV